MPHSVASDLVLHCLPMSHKKDEKLIWPRLKKCLIRSFKVTIFSLFGFYIKINELCV